MSLVVKSLKYPEIRETAIKIVDGCDAKDDNCELQAIFDAVKHGNPNIPGLESGVKYIPDPEMQEHYTAPQKLLSQCEQGLCAEDCDGQSALVASLAMSVGFQVRLRIYKPPGSQFYEHVYAVAGLPKNDPSRWVGLDTTVAASYVGWEPQGAGAKYRDAVYE